MKREDFEIYAGCNFSIEENEYLMLKNVKPELLMKERELMDGRWFDYRNLHPTSATLLFNHVYYKELTRAYHRDVDIKEARKMESKSRSGLFSQSKHLISQMWSARQMADKLCCPYNIFIAAGMFEAREQGWKRFPAPGQLASEQILTSTCEYWSRYQDSALPQPVRVDLLGPSAEDSIWRTQYQYYLAAEIESRPGPLRIILSSAIALSQLLDESVARDYFGDDTVNQALRCFNPN